MAAPAAAAVADIIQKNAAVLPMARDFVNFLNEAVTPFHAVAWTARILEANGFKRISEHENPTGAVAPGDKVFYTRNMSAIVAYAVGGKYQSGNGLKVVGAHTDSPNIAVRPRTHAKKEQWVGIGTQLYGGGIWNTWFDRELTVGGRVVVQPAGTTTLESRLVNLEKPILRIPNLAIHLRDDREGFKPDKEKHVAPVIATEAMAAAVNELTATANGQNATLMRLIAESAKCTPEEIVDFDLSLFDTQPASITGAFDEFVCGARLDNLISCYCGTRALVDTMSTLDSDDMIRLIAFFDHEECGSSSVPGAGGSLIPDIVERILHGSNSAATRAALAARSFMMSVDGAHGLHPNYPEKHQSQHRPTLHGGPVLKYHPNQRYATSGMTASVVLALGRLAGVPVQQFGVSNESPCGSTIGPILSTLTGIPTVDLGNPMLSMHSIRESCGTVDLEYLTKLLKSFFESFQTLKIQNE